jgi:hypothetical protein
MHHVTKMSANRTTKRMRVTIGRTGDVERRDYRAPGSAAVAAEVHCIGRTVDP